MAIAWLRNVVRGLSQTTGAVMQSRAGSFLDCTLQAEEIHTIGEPVVVEFHLHNRGDCTIHILTWYTPLEGILGEVFRVTRDGSDVPYRGILAKRGLPGPDEYVPIEPGRAVSARVDLAEGYDLSEPGRYHVEFTSRLWDITDDGSSIPRSLDAHQPMELPCSTVSFRVIDRNA